MPAYIIGRLQMRDPSWLEKYRATVPSLVAKHRGTYRVRGGKMETLEGNTPLPSSFVVLEFPTMERAKEWLNCEEYREPRKMRHRTAKTNMIVVEGV